MDTKLTQLFQSSEFSVSKNLNSGRKPAGMTDYATIANGCTVSTFLYPQRRRELEQGFIDLAPATMDDLFQVDLNNGSAG